MLGVHPDAPFLPGIAPGQLIALPLRIRLRPRDACYLNVHPDTDAHVEHCDDMHWSTTMTTDVCPARAHITVNAVDENGVNVASAPILLELRCRKALEPFVFTFLDHDGSISSAAVVLPLYSKRSAALSPLASVPVVLSLHGTGVSAQAQAEAYKVFEFVSRS